jgi:hypothetical protein
VICCVCLPGQATNKWNREKADKKVHKDKIRGAGDDGDYTGDWASNSVP